MRTLVLSRNGRFATDVPTSEIDAALREAGTLLWLDLQSPDEDDLRLLRDEFGFHPLAIEDASRAHERPKVDAYERGDAGPPAAGSTLPAPEPPGGADAGVAAAGRLAGPAGALPGPAADAAADGPFYGSYYFLVFYAAAFDEARDHITTQALNLFVGANFLVTVHHDPLPRIDETIARWRAPGGPLEHRVGALVHALLDAIVDDFFPLMDQVADRVEELEDAIFVHFDEAAIRTIFALKKDLLALRRVVAPERDVLNVMLRRQLHIFRSEDVAYLQDVYDHLVRVTDNVDTYRDLLTSALDSYLSLQSNRLNEIVKVLTIASIILMADALVTGFYGQNFVFFPELKWATGSFWSLGLMAVVTTGLVIYFRRKRWL